MNNQDNRPVVEQVEQQAGDLAAFLRILRRRFGLIAFITLFSVTIGAALSYFILPPVYETKTTLLVTRATQHLQAPSQIDDFDSVLQSVVRIPVLTMNTYVEQAKSEILLQRVIERLNLAERGVTVRSLAGQINVAVAKDSNFIEISVRNSDPDLAVRIANTMNREYMLLINEKNLELIDQSIKAMQEQASVIHLKLAVSQLEPEQDLLRQTLGFLEEKIRQARMVRAIDHGSTGLVALSPPLRPDYPIKPDKLLNLAMSLALGLTGSVLLAVVLEACTAARAGESRSAGLELARSWQDLLSRRTGPDMTESG